LAVGACRPVILPFRTTVALISRRLAMRVPPRGNVMMHNPGMK
jgi:hypothetical protein